MTRFGNEIYLYTISTTLLKGFNDILLCILGLIVAPSKGKKLKLRLPSGHTKKYFNKYFVRTDTHENIFSSSNDLMWGLKVVSF